MKKSSESTKSLTGIEELLSIRHQVKEFKKAHYLFREGDRVEGIFIIRSGKISIEKVTPNGRELTLKICGPDQLVGEVTIFSEAPTYMLDARAVEETVCFHIGMKDLEEALLLNSQLAMNFMKWMGIDQQKTQTKFRDLLLHGKKGALYSTLIRLSNSYGVETEKGILIDMVLTNQELANFCGMTREVVNRLLGNLKKNGTLSLSEGKILLHDMEYLKTETNCENCPIYLCKID
ncbi:MULTISPECIES: Crp/Fnr family transcriptional regulator [Planococcus]|uniref:Crp/Fnr family transcriptional regulator n=1 Tax=Planococcus faecalis TaxID=1598147 RepID=A0ABM6IWD7_9BACL|nr:MULTISPECIES: Crp/Fnr family transcriptional regulator [Planococcus]AQU80808.1 Crp/Fnr family transcriptional regulator [Planococcus faecalis]MDJ0332026.1 Crp/Fnr family transcriptional regulator [Planococcus sp. S3-L1]OHX55794.1 Crp/Fnr family transcriptional regulator [Planococcus faecalis]